MRRWHDEPADGNRAGRGGIGAVVPRLGRVVVGAGLLALVGAAPAPAAPPWSAPVVVRAVNPSPHVVLTGDGRPAILSGSDLLTLDAAGTPRVVGRLPAMGFVPRQLAADSGSGVLIAGATSGSPGGGALGRASRPAIVSGRLGAALPAPQTVPASRPGWVEDAAADLRGNAALLVRQLPARSCGGGRELVLFVRRAGARFRRVARLACGALLRESVVEVGPDGAVLAAWEQDHVVHARLLTAAGRLGPDRPLGRAWWSRLSAALGARGRALVAWSATRHQPPGALPVTVAYARSAGRFASAQVVEQLPRTDQGPDATSPPGGVRALLAAGRGLLTWTGHDQGGYRVRAAPVTSGGLGAAQTLASPSGDAILADAALSRRGTATVLWLNAGARPTELLAATRAAEVAAFGPPEVVSPLSTAAAPTTITAGLVSTSVDPVSGRVLAAWAGSVGSVSGSWLAVRPGP